MPISRNIKRLGFTLVELLVGMAVLILLAGVLAGIFSSVSATWQTAHANTQRMQSVRAITDMISAELGTAILPLSRTDVASLQLIVNPSIISDSYRHPDAVFWQAPVATDLGLGDIAAVGYFIRWDESDSGRPRALLCRLEVAAPDAGFLVYSQDGGATPWLTDAVLEAEAPADEANLYAGLVAENVVALFVTSIDESGRQITQAFDGGGFDGADEGFDSRQGYTDADGIRSGEFVGDDGFPQPLSVLPPRIQVSFVMIDERIALRIGAAEKARLVSLANSVAARSPKGNASDFVAAALADSSLDGISGGLHAHHTEVNLLNSR